MVEFKCVINNPKTGKSYSKVCDESILIGKKIKDTIAGDSLGLKGYELAITGGSDDSGFPMRPDVHGTERKKALISSGVGIKKLKRAGLKIRKSVRGSTISDRTVQVNLKIVKFGKDDLETLLGVKKEGAETTENADKS